MAKKRRKTATRTTVSKCLLDKLAHLGATHHKTLSQLKASARTCKIRKKARKKTAKKRARRR